MSKFKLKKAKGRVTSIPKAKIKAAVTAVYAEKGRINTDLSPSTVRKEPIVYHITND